MIKFILLCRYLKYVFTNFESETLQLYCKDLVERIFTEKIRNKDNFSKNEIVVIFQYCQNTENSTIKEIKIIKRIKELPYCQNIIYELKQKFCIDSFLYFDSFSAGNTNCKAIIWLFQFKDPIQFENKNYLFRAIFYDLMNTNNDHNAKIALEERSDLIKNCSFNESNDLTEYYLKKNIQNDFDYYE